MKAYWCLGYGFGNYELFIVKAKDNYNWIENVSEILGAKIVTKGELEIDESDFNNFVDSKNHKNPKKVLFGRSKRGPLLASKSHIFFKILSFFESVKKGRELMVFI